jgi:peptidoglycan/LPS O-acetylase OafA/YrhL
MPSKNPSRLEVLDCFRGIAALSVVLFHFTTLFYNEYNYTNCSFSMTIGHFGVQLFFILSGFVIFLSIRNIERPWQFIKKRIVRLYPAYWISILLSFFIIYLFADPNFRPSTWKELLVGLTMLNGFVGVDNVDTSYWSLRPELVFYFFISLLLFFKARKYMHVFMLLSTMLLVVDFIFPLPIFISRAINIPFCGYFFSGIYFYLFFDTKNKLYLIPVLIFCIINVLLEKQEYGVIVLPFIYLLFVLFTYGKLNFLNNIFFKFLGYISYPLYLLHQNIGVLILSKLVLWFPRLNYFYVLTIVLIAVIFLAFLVAKFAEPFVQKITKKVLN